MTSVEILGFIASRTLKNLLRRQLQRLRQPRYAAATAMGLLYFWSIFARHGARPPRGMEMSVGTTVLGAFMLAMALLLVLWTWAFGGDEASLTFGESEIQFLFPAPLSRRTLVNYKLVRTVLLSGFTALFLTWGLGTRVGAPGLRFFAGAWIGVATLGLHNIAASLTRASLLQHGAAGLLRRSIGLIFPLAILASVGWAAWQVPLPGHGADVPGWFEGLVSAGPLRWTSLPFRPALEVALALPGSRLPISLLAALVSLALHYAWALSTDADFQDASIASAEKRARRMEARRAGRLPLRSARAPFKLGPSGNPIVALVWKNLTAAVRLLSLRLAIVLGISSAAMVLPILFIGGESRRVLGAGAAVLLAGYFTLFGTQVYRIDFRLDLPNIDLLRTLPLRGWQIAAGEVLAPMLVIAGAQWLCLIAATALVPQETLGPVNRVATGVALAMLLPPINLCLVVVQNAGVLLFPGWVQGGAQGPRGIEAMGQRLLTLVGTLLAAAIALVPASIAAIAVAAGTTYLWNSESLGVVLGAAVGAGLLFVEAAFGVLGLGRLFERFDLGQA